MDRAAERGAAQAHIRCLAAAHAHELSELSVRSLNHSIGYGAMTTPVESPAPPSLVRRHNNMSPILMQSFEMKPPQASSSSVPHVPLREEEPGQQDQAQEQQASEPVSPILPLTLHHLQQPQPGSPPLTSASHNHHHRPPPRHAAPPCSPPPPSSPKAAMLHHHSSSSSSWPLPQTQNFQHGPPLGPPISQGLPQHYEGSPQAPPMYQPYNLQGGLVEGKEQGKELQPQVSPQEMAARKQWAQEVRELEDATGRRAEEPSLSGMPSPPPSEAPPQAVPATEGLPSNDAEAGAAAAMALGQDRAGHNIAAVFDNDDTVSTGAAEAPAAPGPIQFDVTFESERLGMGLAEAKNPAHLPTINVAPPTSPSSSQSDGFAVQVGDRLKAVNGVPLINGTTSSLPSSSVQAPHAAALHAIRTGGRPIVLTFERDHPATTSESAATNSTAAAPVSGVHARSSASFVWWFVVLPLLLAGGAAPFLLASLHRHCAAPGSIDGDDSSAPTTTHWIRGSSVGRLLPLELLPESVSFEWVEPLAEPLERSLGHAKKFACVAVQPGGQLAPYAEQALVWAQLSQARAAAAGAAMAAAVETHAPADLNAVIQKWRARSSSFYIDRSGSSSSSSGSGGRGSSSEISTMEKDVSGAAAFMRAEMQEFGELLMGVAQELAGLRAEMGEKVAGAFNQVSHSVQNSMAQRSEGSRRSSSEESGSSNEMDGTSDEGAAESTYSSRYSYDHIDDGGSDASSGLQSDHEIRSNIEDDDEEEAEPEMPDDIPNLPTAMEGNSNLDGQPTILGSANAAAATEGDLRAEPLDELTMTPHVKMTSHQEETAVPPSAYHSDDEKAASLEAPEDAPVIARYRVEGIDSTKIHAEL